MTNIKDRLINLFESNIKDNIIIPEYDQELNYPGNILPGYYTQDEIINIININQSNKSVLQFIADMLE